MNLCIIPARGGSARIPRKNIKDFMGKPIIEYSIDLAHQSELFDFIIVTTDDNEIADIVSKLGVHVHWRSPDDGCRGTQEIAAEVLQHEGRMYDAFYDEACVIYATAPLLTADNIIDGRELLKQSTSMTYCYSVDSTLKDTGGFYYSTALAFMADIPLKGNSVQLVTGDVDIDTPEEWDYAEKLYEERHENN